MKKKPYGTARVVCFSILCVILTFVLTSALLGSVSMHLMTKQVPEAVDAVKLEELSVPLTSGEEVPMAKFIHDTYIKDDRITEQQIETILKEGTFTQEAADLIGEYSAYLQDPSKEFPEVTDDRILAALEANKALIQQQTGLYMTAKDQEKLRENLQQPLDNLNKTLDSTLHRGTSGFAAQAAVSLWTVAILGILLLVVFVWTLQIHARGKGFLGTGCKLFAITALIPSAVLLLSGLLSVWLLDYFRMQFLETPVQILRQSLIVTGALASLVCMAILVFGIIWNTAGKHARRKAAVQADAAYEGSGDIPEQTMPETAPEERELVTASVTSAPVSKPEPMPESAARPEPLPAQENAEPAGTRRFCRFCGQPLVNENAKFCYRCGKTQEETEKEHS